MVLPEPLQVLAHNPPTLLLAAVSLLNTCQHPLPLAAVNIIFKLKDPVTRKEATHTPLPPDGTSWDQDVNESDLQKTESHYMISLYICILNDTPTGGQDWILRTKKGQNGVALHLLEKALPLPQET